MIREADLFLNFLRLLVTACVSAAVLSGPVSATPAKEAPWLPEAAAYRLTLFLGNLEPLPWDQVADAWSEPYRNSEFSSGALEWLDAKSGVNAKPVQEAIARQDRQALFAGATRLIALRTHDNSTWKQRTSSHQTSNTIALR